MVDSLDRERISKAKAEFQVSIFAFYQELFHKFSQRRKTFPGFISVDTALYFPGHNQGPLHAEQRHPGFRQQTGHGKLNQEETIQTSSSCMNQSTSSAAQLFPYLSRTIMLPQSFKNPIFFYKKEIDSATYTPDCWLPREEP